ncbi:MAG: CHASE3 domain-containing protein [Chitinophagaceae bacterium]|nr:CHASE3 domain-containing protein [Chitinophagaceae bacterium]
MKGQTLEKKFANRVRIGFLAAFVLLLVSNALSFISTQKVSQQAAWVDHTNLVIHDLDNLASFITKAESAIRGYLIDRNKEHLMVFNKSVKEVDSVTDLIEKATTDNPLQQREMDSLKKVIGSMLFSIQNRLNNFREDSKLTPEIISENEQRERMMVDIGARIQRIQENERESWSQRSENISEYSSLIKYLSLVSMLVAIVLTLYSVTVFNKENKARQEADKQTDLFKMQLESRVNQLAELNTELIELRSLEKYSSTGRIARTIAHEVRNPLTNINLALEQLRSDYPAADEGADMFFDMIKRNSERINKLVSDLLNSTRLTELKKSPVNINDLLNDCISDAQDRIRLEHIQVIKNFDKHICPIQLDVERIKIAFLNFIVNAVEAMKEGGTLAVETSVERNKCHIKISDTGNGMSKEQMGRLFEPFFTTKAKGTGLGLANAQNIIISHNGSIKVESEEGKGTTFHIFFDVPEKVAAA